MKERIYKKARLLTLFLLFASIFAILFFTTAKTPIAFAAEAESISSSPTQAAAFSQMLLWYGYPSGAGKFGYYGTATTHSSFNGNAVNGRVVAGDFDGDGKFEIAALFHNGNGTGNMLLWKWQTNYLGYYGVAVSHMTDPFGIIPFNDASGRMVVGDFDHDGREDIAAFVDVESVVKIQFWRGSDTVACLSYNSEDFI